MQNTVICWVFEPWVVSLSLQHILFNDLCKSIVSPYSLWLTYAKNRLRWLVYQSKVNVCTVYMLYVLISSKAWNYSQLNLYELRPWQIWLLCQKLCIGTYNLLKFWAIKAEDPCCIFKLTYINFDCSYIYKRYKRWFEILRSTMTMRIKSLVANTFICV